MVFHDDPTPEATGEQQDALFDEFGPAADPATDAAPETGLPPELPAPHPAEARVADLEQELREVRDWATRIAADFENFKKRAERERQEQSRFSSERLLKEFLPIVDNLQRALAAGIRDAESPALTAGVELVLGETMKMLRKAGVEPIPAAGRPFDPAVHDALQQVETDTVEPGCVVQEVQPGYQLNGRVLRPALVTVAIAPEITTPGVASEGLES